MDDRKKLKMSLRALPRPSWTVETLTIAGPNALSRRGEALQVKLRELEEKGHKVSQITETCVPEEKSWHYTIICYN